MFEAETENKHIGFHQAYAPTAGLNFVLDTLELKGVAGHTGATGSFSADALPNSEMTIGCGQMDREAVLSALYGSLRYSPNDEGHQIDY